jgi:PAS domain S-box-containing protein
MDYRLLFDATPSPLIAAEHDGTVVDANEAACALLGRPPGTLRGLALHELAADPLSIELPRLTLLQSGEWRGELELNRPDGENVPVDVTARVAPLDGRRIAILALTDARERLERWQAQRELVSLLGHELRSPISALKGYAQLMQRRAAYDPDAMVTIVRQADRLSRMVGALTDASRIAAGQLELRRKEMELLARIAIIVEAARDSDSDTAIAIEGPGDPVVGHWDRDRVDHVVSSLVVNALTYAPGAPIVVRVQDLGDEALVSVADQGPGIEPEILPQVFERFYRAPAAIAASAKGLGLGLYVARGVVEAHGGRIWVESALDRGSTFTFTLPKG